MDLIENLNYYYYEMADPRVRDLFLMGSIWQPILIVFSYLYFILQCGPRYMKNRPAYDLRMFIRFYNIFQIVTNAFIAHEILAAYPDALAFQCVPVTYSTSSAALRATRACYFAVLLKIIDLVETGIFLFRKKNNQITVLHLYHHTTTVLIGMISIRYVSGGMALFIFTLNCGVHVIMYSYYMLSNIDGPIKKMVLPLKRYITIIQMIQFVFMLIHVFIALLPSCPFQKVTAYLMLVNVIFNFVLFYNFYKKTYLHPKIKKA